MSPGPLPPPTQTFTQPYSTYPQAYGQYSTQSYPSANYASQTQAAVYPGGFQVPYSRKDPTSWIDALSPQELSGVNPETASRVMHRFISAELKHEGFDAAEPVTLDRLEAEVVHFIQDLHRKIHDYANLANRTTPLASDMFDISQEYGLDTDSLQLISELSKLRRRDSTTVNESLTFTPCGTQVAATQATFIRRRGFSAHNTKYTSLYSPLLPKFTTKAHISPDSSFATKKASTAILGEEIEKCKPCPGIATKPSFSDRRRRRTR